MQEKLKRPKGPRTSYNYFVQDCKNIWSRTKGKTSFSKFSKLCAAKWKHLTKKDKEKYEKLAREDTSRYKKELKEFSKKELKLLKKQRRDPKAPVKPMNSYIWFCHVRWKSVANSHPEMTFKEIRKELARLWRECSPETKKKYELLADYDRRCFRNEQTEYERERARAKGREPKEED